MTARGIQSRYAPPSSTNAPGSWPPATCTRHCARTVPTGRHCNPDATVAVLTEEVGRGALDRGAVRCVLDGAGIGTPVRGDWPAGLTDREVEVLRLVARGGTNKDVARALRISHRTVQHHVDHIYDKIGVTSRAGAALFAAQQGLTGPGT